MISEYRVRDDYSSLEALPLNVHVNKSRYLDSESINSLSVVSKIFYRHSGLFLCDYIARKKKLIGLKIRSSYHFGLDRLFGLDRPCLYKGDSDQYLRYFNMLRKRITTVTDFCETQKWVVCKDRSIGFMILIRKVRDYWSYYVSKGGLLPIKAMNVYDIEAMGFENKKFTLNNVDYNELNALSKILWFGQADLGPLNLEKWTLIASPFCSFEEFLISKGQYSL